MFFKLANFHTAFFQAHQYHLFKDIALILVG